MQSTQEDLQGPLDNTSFDLIKYKLAESASVCPWKAFQALCNVKLAYWVHS